MQDQTIDAKRLPAAPEIELVTDNGNGLYVRCLWQHDRFGHEIGLIDAGNRIPILSSCEGCAEDVWPVSPPLQQIHSQDVDGNPVLFGIGMSGASHYSTSMLLAAVEESIELQIESAVVAKTQNASKATNQDSNTIHLGSRLNCFASFELTLADSTARITETDSPHRTVQVSADSKYGQLSVLTDNQLEIRPLDAQKSGTTQWKYRFRWQG